MKLERKTLSRFAAGAYTFEPIVDLNRHANRAVIRRFGDGDRLKYEIPGNDTTRKNREE